MPDQQLKEDIVDAAVEYGEFTLSSGGTSDYYIDKYLFETRPELLRDIASELSTVIRNTYENVDRIAVPALGGVPLGAVLCVEMDLPYVIVRKEQKEYGTESKIEGTFSEDERVVIVEDIVTTASEAIRTLKTLREAHLNVLGVTCVVSREEGGEENLADHGIELQPLLTATELGLK